MQKKALKYVHVHVHRLVNDQDSTWMAQVLGLRKEFLPFLPKAKLTYSSSRAGLIISSMLPSTTSCSPSLGSMLAALNFMANSMYFFYRAAFDQLCSSCLSMNWQYELSRPCGVAQRLLQLSAAAALFISLSLLCMVKNNISNK